MEVRKFNQIDSLRFLAVLAVLFVHWDWAGKRNADMFLTGARGVDLFFVISGFLIALGLIKVKQEGEKPGVSLYKFYIRRFLRIFPAYYLMLLLVWFLNHKKVADGIWWYLLYASNFYSIKIQDWGGLIHLWSLSIEEQFYLVWPFVILFVPRRFLLPSIALSVALSLLTKIYWAYTGASFWVQFMHPVAALDALAIGGLLAYIYFFHQAALKSFLCNFFVSAVFIFQLLLCMGLKFTSDYHFIYDIGIRTSFSIFCFWLIGRSVFGFTGITGKILDNKIFQYVGKISYGLYLYHFFVPGMLMGLKYPEECNLRFVLYLLVTIAISALSWRYFEKPILKYKEKFE